MALSQGQTCRGLHKTVLAIRFDSIGFWIDCYSRHGIIELHILLSDVSATANGFHPLAEIVGCDSTWTSKLDINDVFLCKGLNTYRNLWKL